MMLGTNMITQIGLVVKDIDKSIDAYCDLLSLPRPTPVITDEFESAQTQYAGKPSFARAKLAFFNMGQVQIELIEPIGEPSTWKDCLDQKGEGFHHIAFVIKDTDSVVQYFASKDVPLVQQGKYPGGMYSYLDATQKLGLFVELLENFNA
jgi:methylmalonyl-CoA/ethylmalonyl-CoA epimerase